MWSDTVAQETADFLFSFKNRHRVAVAGKIGSGSDPGRSGSDDRHPLRPFLTERFSALSLAMACSRWAGSRALVVSEKTLDVPDGNRIVHAASAAGILAGVGADPAADAGQDVVPPDQRQGLCHTFPPGKGHISLGIDAQGAVFLAEGLPALVDIGPARQAGPG